MIVLCKPAAATELHSWHVAVDVKLHEYLLKSSLRQMDPDKASIFFVPVYLAKLFNWFWTRQHCTSEDQDPLSCMKEPNVRPDFDTLSRGQSPVMDTGCLVVNCVLGRGACSCGRIAT